MCDHTKGQQSRATEGSMDTTDMLKEAKITKQGVASSHREDEEGRGQQLPGLALKGV